MKYLTLACVLCVATALIVGCSVEQPNTSQRVELELKGTWEEIEFTSQALKGNLVGDPDTRFVRIYLPPGYESSTDRYPVVFGLHGYLEDPTWLHGMGRALNDLLTEGKAKEMILVMPDGGNLFGGSFYLNSPVTGDYETYIVEDLVRFIDSNYRTIPTRSSRGIAGCSMGANGALHLALTYPEVFSVAAGASGGYAYEDYNEWQDAVRDYSEGLVPTDLEDIHLLPWYIRVFFALAAATADVPVDSAVPIAFPLEIEGTTSRINQEVMTRIRDANVYQDVRDYLSSSDYDIAIAIFHGVYDENVLPDRSREFSAFLVENQIESVFTQVDDGHCDRSWDYRELLLFMSENLHAE
jgi:enterochelin esterase-like enzyme